MLFSAETASGLSRAAPSLSASTPARIDGRNNASRVSAINHPPPKHGPGRSRFRFPARTNNLRHPSAPTPTAKLDGPSWNSADRHALSSPWRGFLYAALRGRDGGRVRRKAGRLATPARFSFFFFPPTLAPYLRRSYPTFVRRKLFPFRFYHFHYSGRCDRAYTCRLSTGLLE
jgi:hypothetical protein